MRSLFLILLAAVTFTSVTSSAKAKESGHLKNTSQPGVTAHIMVVNDDGVPITIGFLKGEVVIGTIDITSSTDDIDTTVGETYDATVSGPEGDTCRASGKLIPLKNAFKIEFYDTGTAFKKCPEYQIQGIYKK